MLSGWMHLLKTGVKLGVAAKSKLTGRTVTAEEIVADFFNEMTQSGDVNGIKVVELIDKQHICGK